MDDGMTACLTGWGWLPVLRETNTLAPDGEGGPVERENPVGLKRVKVKEVEWAVMALAMKSG